MSAASTPPPLATHYPDHGSASGATTPQPGLSPSSSRAAKHHLTATPSPSPPAALQGVGPPTSSPLPPPLSESAREHMARVHERRCAVRRVLMDFASGVDGRLSDALAELEALGAPKGVRVSLDTMRADAGLMFKELLGERLPAIDQVDSEGRGALAYRVAQLRDEVRIHRTRIGRHKRQFFALAELCRSLRRRQTDARTRLELFLNSFQNQWQLHNTNNQQQQKPLPRDGGAAAAPLVRPLSPSAVVGRVGSPALPALTSTAATPRRPDVDNAGPSLSTTTTPAAVPLQGVASVSLPALMATGGVGAALQAVFGPDAGGGGDVGTMASASDRLVGPRGKPYILPEVLGDAHSDEAVILELQDTLAGLPLFEPDEVDGIVADALKRAAASHDAELAAVRGELAALKAGEEQRCAAAAAAAVREFEDERRLAGAVRKEYEDHIDELRRALDACESVAQANVKKARASKDRHLHDVQARLDFANLDRNDLLDRYTDMRVDAADKHAEVEEIKGNYIAEATQWRREQHQLKLRIADLLAQLEAVDSPEDIAKRAIAPYVIQVSNLGEAIRRSADELEAANAVIDRLTEERDAARVERDYAHRREELAEKRAAEAAQRAEENAASASDAANQLAAKADEAATLAHDLHLATSEIDRVRAGNAELEAALGGLREAYNKTLLERENRRTADGGTQTFLHEATCAVAAGPCIGIDDFPLCAVGDGGGDTMDEDGTDGASMEELALRAAWGTLRNFTLEAAAVATNAEQHHPGTATGGGGGAGSRPASSSSPTPGGGGGGRGRTASSMMQLSGFFDGGSPFTIAVSPSAKDNDFFGGGGGALLHQQHRSVAASDASMFLRQSSAAADAAAAAADASPGAASLLPAPSFVGDFGKRTTSSEAMLGGTTSQRRSVRIAVPTASSSDAATPPTGHSPRGAPPLAPTVRPRQPQPHGGDVSTAAAANADGGDEEGVRLMAPPAPAEDSDTADRDVSPAGRGFATGMPGAAGVGGLALARLLTSADRQRRLGDGPLVDAGSRPATAPRSRRVLHGLATRTVAVQVSTTSAPSHDNTTSIPRSARTPPQQHTRSTQTSNTTASDDALGSPTCGALGWITVPTPRPPATARPAAAVPPGALVAAAPPPRCNNGHPRTARGVSAAAAGAGAVSVAGTRRVPITQLSLLPESLLQRRREQVAAESAAEAAATKKAKRQRSAKKKAKTNKALHDGDEGEDEAAAGGKPPRCPDP